MSGIRKPGLSTPLPGVQRRNDDPEAKALEQLGRSSTREAKAEQGKKTSKKDGAPKAKKAKATEQARPDEQDSFGFDRGVGTDWQTPLQNIDPDGRRSKGGAGTRVSARLMAVGKGDLDKATIDRNVLIEVPDDLQLLLGVGVIKGDLEIAESAVTSGEMALVKDLVSVEGRLAIEGNAIIERLDGFAQLEHLGKGLYVGFNDRLQQLMLPRLKQSDGPLVVEGNAQLKKLSLPSLQVVLGYLHVHENDALETVLAKKLLDVGKEISFVDNPVLRRVALDALVNAGADGSRDVEIERSGVAAQLTL